MSKKPKLNGTGRLTSTEPALQNIPVRTETSRKLREAFTVEKGYVFISPSLNQIEIRLLAQLDPRAHTMADAFARLYGGKKKRG